MELFSIYKLSYFWGILQIILACYNKHHFSPYLKAFKTNPLVWSNGLMSPEAYTLKWAIDDWFGDESGLEIVNKPRKTYNHYQKCEIKGVTNLLVTRFKYFFNYSGS